MNATSPPKKRRRKTTGKSASEEATTLALAPAAPAIPVEEETPPLTAESSQAQEDLFPTAPATPEPTTATEETLAAAVPAALLVERIEAPAPEAPPPPCPAKTAVQASDEVEDEQVVERVEHLSKDVAWVLIAAGVIGVVMPGVLGTPFLIAGAAALWPGNQKRLEKWRQGHSPKFFHGGMKQINRFLDDLERRYPRDGGKR